jgi:hypothetical protein
VNAKLEEQDILTFVGAALKSVWALELLIRMRQTRERSWRKVDLVRELRASTKVVDQSLENLENTGLVAVFADAFRYSPASALLDTFAEGAERLYREKPVAVINAIAATQNEKLKLFAEAFRLKE